MINLGIDGGLSYRLIEYFFVNAGLRAGYAIVADYSQEERIIQPDTKGTFIDGKRVRNVFSGNLFDANKLIFGLNIGMHYELPLNEVRSYLLVPSLNYHYILNPVVSGLSWYPSSLRIGAGIKYKEPPEPPPPPPPPPQAPIPQLPLPLKPPIAKASVRAIQVDSMGIEKADFSIKIEDFISLNMRPLLNYVFFEENASMIPNRYNLLFGNGKSKFSANQLQNLNALQTYYQLLNIVGSRLLEYPSARITLTGTNANIGVEKNNLELSFQRANKVKDYLVGIWRIAPERIKIEAVNLPKQASESSEEGADDENRRVEISSDDSRLLEPVLTVDTLRETSKFKLRFLMNARSDAGIAIWELSVKQNEDILFAESGNGMPPKYVEWNLADDNVSGRIKSGRLLYSLRITDSLGQTVQSSQDALPVEQLTIDRKRLERMEDKEYEYYSLILFDYGKSRLEKEHRKVLDFVKNRLSDNAKVVIYGYTDRIGDEPINQKLSTQRAKEVAKILKLPSIEATGKGESELLYDNNLPEGRFYCRTVKIEIITPVTE